jgi:hypothetical protein
MTDTDELTGNTNMLGSNIPAAAKATKSVKKPAEGMPTYQRIVLEENESIPPTGLFIGHNGKGYLLKPGEEANVPVEVIQILRESIISVAQTDGSGTVIGYRDRSKYPFRMVG